MDLSDLQMQLENDESYNSDPLTQEINPEVLSTKSIETFSDILNITKFCVKKSEYSEYVNTLLDLLGSLHSDTKASTLKENSNRSDTEEDDTENIEDLNQKIEELNLQISDLKKENTSLNKKINELQDKDNDLLEMNENASSDINFRIQSFNAATEQMIINLENRENHLDAYLAHMKEEFDNYLNKKSTK